MASAAAGSDIQRRVRHQQSGAYRWRGRDPRLHRSLAASINSLDEIVGESFSNNTSVMHAFRWKGGAYTVLHCLPERYCEANSINDAE